jgi:hypothetical protein
MGDQREQPPALQAHRPWLAWNPQVTLRGEQSRGAEVRGEVSAQMGPPTVGHVADRPHRRQVGDAAQRVLASTVDDALRLDRLASAQRLRFEEDGVVAAPPQVVERPQARDASTEDQDIQGDRTGMRRGAQCPPPATPTPVSRGGT